jgi:3-oxoacyl-[acyl-carrier-protein] synthase II
MLGSRRVVVTGMGILSPVGNTLESAWQAILSGSSGVSTIQEFDASEYAVKIYAGIKGFETFCQDVDILDSKDCRRLSAFIQYAVCTAWHAYIDSGLNIDESNATRVGAFIGSGVGGLPMTEKMSLALSQHGPKKVTPFFVPGSITNMASGVVSQKLNCQGPNLSMVSACASGSHSIGYAARAIAYGDADVMFAGAAEKSSSPIGIAGFSSLKALAANFNDAPSKASRPWDKARNGFVLGDGAGVLVLEEYEHARKRGAKIYAELTGFGMSSDAYHLTQPEPNGRGMLHAMRSALNDAGVSPEVVDYINAHGTSTPLGDMIEYGAVEKLFGSSRSDLVMSSTKSMTGHLLGAAGAIEAIFSIMAIRDNIAPPTINLDNPEDGIHINLAPNAAVKHKIDVAISNSFGFGGTNSCLVFSGL